MGCDVYANGDEIACKAGDGKVIAAFPDVCLSPPSPPAGPIPVPYPDTSFSKDMQNGSKTVKIKGQEVMLKDKSFYKTAPLGDEAATQGLGANVITHVITGKTYFVMWSLDVKIEGENVDRHIDLTTSNHASIPPGVPKPGPNCSSQELGAWEDREGVCACCDNAQHACQTGAPVTDERGYYGLDEHVPSNPPLPDLMGVPIGASPAATRSVESRNMDSLNDWQAKCDALQKRRDDLDARKKAVFDARRSGCESLPEYPCNVYRIVTPAQTESCDVEWRGASAGWKARQTPAIPAGEKVNHRVPKSAGGCPTGDANLVADSQLKGKGPGDCSEIDGRLTKAQTSAVEGRQKGHF
jgi:hypothetical protein